jgi:uncharacterized membrane protein
MKQILFYFLLFFIYSFIGWTIEVINCSVREKKFVMRGFLIGPYCPIYGTSALLMILLLNRHSDDLLVLFTISLVIASLLEYVTSYLMEKIFNVRWWDYSDKKFHINGRVCLENSILFGILGIVLILFIHPYIINIIDNINSTLILFLSIFIAIIMILDTIISYTIISKIKIDITTIYKDYTEIIDNKVWEMLKNNSIFRKRILNAFPKLKIRKIK